MKYQNGGSDGRWCIQTVMVHKSLQTAEKDVITIKSSTPDCDILKKVQLKKDKIAYTISYGTAPFFHKQIIKEVEASDYYSVGFDESLNKITKLCQMDISVRYWKEKEGEQDKGEVVTKYLTSIFLERTALTSSSTCGCKGVLKHHC